MSGYDIFLTMGDSNGYNGDSFDAGLDLTSSSIYQLGVTSPNANQPLASANDPLDGPDPPPSSYIGPYVHFLYDYYIPNGLLVSPRNAMVVFYDYGGSSAVNDNGTNWGALGGTPATPTTSSGSLLDKQNGRLAAALALTGTNTVKAVIGIEGSNAYTAYANTWQLGAISKYRWQIKRKIQYLRNLVGPTVPIVMSRESTYAIDFAHSTYDYNGIAVDAIIRSMVQHFPYLGVADSQTPTQLGTGAIHFTAADQRTLAGRYYDAYIAAQSNTGTSLQWDAVDFVDKASYPSYVAGFTITNSNLDISGDASSGWKAAVAVPPCRSGKVYAEVKVQAKASGTNLGYLGFANADWGLQNQIGASAPGNNGAAAMSAGQWGGLGDNAVNGYTKDWTSNASWTTNDIIMLAVDMTAGKAWIGKNGTWYNSGDPVAGTGQWISGIVDPIYIAASVYTGTGNTYRLVPSAFTYTPPTGFVAWVAAPVSDTNIAPAEGTLSLAGYAPAVALPQNVIPAVGELVITGYAPAVLAGGNRNIIPDAGTLTIAGSAPAVIRPSTAAHRYWRLYCTANHGDTKTGITELEMHTAQFGKNVCSGGTAIYSSQYDTGTYAAVNAFDSVLFDSPSHWASDDGSPQWIGYDFGAGNEKNIHEISVWPVTYGSDANRNIKDFSIDYSDDGSNWTTSWTETNISWTVSPATFQRFNNQIASYSGSPHGSHAYWRLYIQDYQGHTTIVTIAEIAFRATPGGSNQASGGTPSASSEFGGDPASKAFDANASTFWAASTYAVPQWIAYHFTSGVSVAEVLLQAESANPRCPIVFSIDYSDDGSVWTTAWEVTSAATWTSGSTQTFDDPNYTFSVSPAAGELVLTGYAPVVTPSHYITTVTGSLVVSGSAPSVSVSSNSVTIVPHSGTLTFDRYLTDDDENILYDDNGYPLTVPSICIPIVTIALTGIQPATAELTLAGYAPTVVLSHYIQPAVGELVITGYAPAVSTPAVSPDIVPAAAELIISGYVPYVTRYLTVTPDSGSLTVTGYAPIEYQGPVIVPAAAELTVTGYAPVIDQTRNVYLTIIEGGLSLTGYAPVVSQSLRYRIVSNNVLELPVDAQLADEPLYKETIRTYEIYRNTRTKVRVQAGTAIRWKGYWKDD